MPTLLPIRVAASLAALLVLPAAFAHHGWGDYDAKRELNLTGTIVESSYQNPHATIRLKSGDKTWYAWLAPVSRMESRGMNKDMVKVGATVTLIGYPSVSKPDELRVERIVVAGKATELR
jgi:hypothetical protein